MTKTEWDALCEKGQWDIKVALRGPDCYSAETIKWFTTSVIRGHMAPVFRVGGTVNTDLKVVVLPSGSGDPAYKNKDGWNTKHFAEHVEQAADWISIPIIKIPVLLWKEALCTNTAKLACKRLLDILTSPNSDYNSEKSIAELTRHYKQFLAKGYYD